MLRRYALLLLVPGCFDVEPFVPGGAGTSGGMETGGSTDDVAETGAGTQGGTGSLPMEGCTEDVQCDDENPCTDDVCEDETCAHSPRLDDPACACSSPLDCDALPPDGPCATRTCVDGFCGQAFEADSTPLPEVDQVAEDCLLVVCDGAGGVREAADDSDIAVDGLECTLDTCEGNPPVREGTACEAGTCDADGNCTGCENPDECGGESTFCHQVTCEAMVCGVVETDVGTPLPDGEQTTGDCVRLECDGLGNAAPAADDTDLPSDDGNACTDDICDAGVEAHPPTGAGTACGSGNVCDGNGVCVECNSDAQCGGGDACNLPACVDNMCTTAPASNGTPCNDNLFCTVTDTCNGSGTCTGVGDPCSAQIGDGDNDCSEACQESTDTCSANDPSGSPCNDNLFCTANDTCNSSGTCTGSGNPCPGADGDNDCSETCNENTDLCNGNDPNGSDCGNCRTCDGGSCDFECVSPDICCPASELCLPTQFC